MPNTEYKQIPLVESLWSFLAAIAVVYGQRVWCDHTYWWKCLQNIMLSAFLSNCAYFSSVRVSVHEVYAIGCFELSSNRDVYGEASRDSINGFTQS